MRKLVLEFIAAIALTLAAILALAPGVRANDVLVSGAFARASASPMANSGAVYFTVTNRGTTADRLVGLATVAAQSASIHETAMANDVVSMQMLDQLDIPAGATVALAPGGRHVMLMGLKAPLIQGATIDLDLAFEKAGTLRVKVPVASAGAQAPGG